jgi:hypothetical protein
MVANGALAERYCKEKTEIQGEKLISEHLAHQKCHTDYPACMDEKRKAYRAVIENFKAKDHLEDLGLSKIIILK